MLNEVRPYKRQSGRGIGLLSGCHEGAGKSCTSLMTESSKLGPGKWVIAQLPYNWVEGNI